MKDRRIEQKVIKGLLKRGYVPNKRVLDDLHKTVAYDSVHEKQHAPYYILGLICDYGFYLGMRGSEIKIDL